MTHDTYARTLREIFAYVDNSRNRQHPYNAETYNLDRMRVLARRLGNPQHAFPSLHIAGSKGKGSTSAMVAAVLQAAGFRTGLYTSPHLHTFRERMQINQALIPRERLVRLWRKIQPTVQTLPGTTTFEIITALAFLHFARPPVDWAVLEVGLGGRLDATNIIHPTACAITPLGLEHTRLLGTTLEAIAQEKAGIIKPEVPVITAPQAPEAMAVIERAAAQAQAPLIRVGEDWRWRIRQIHARGLQLDIYGPHSTIRGIQLPLTGAHQAINATVAVALLHALNLPHLTPQVIREGLARTYWPGRLEWLPSRPSVLLDAAHSPQSAARLRQALPLYPRKRLILLFGASADKNIPAILDELAPQADAIILTRSFHPRAADPQHLFDLVHARFPHIPHHLTHDVAPGLELAFSLAQEEDMILVTGSIFVVAAAREAWAHRYPHILPPHDWAHFPEPIDGQITPMR